MRADKQQVARILVIGALPPPFMGPTVAMERLLGFLRGKSHYDLSFLDISDHRDLTSMGKADATNFVLGFKHVFQCLVSLFTKRPHLVYIGISQSRWALARDL